MWFRNIFRRTEQPENEEDGAASGLYLSPKAIRQLNRLQLSASRFLPGTAVGLRSSMRRKPAYDFREHRMYVPGDDVRFVDWKASARQEHIFIKQGEQRKETSVNVLLDCSASMAWGDRPKSKAALEVAAALAFSALSHSDRLLVQPLGQLPFGPTMGKGQVPALLNYLRSLPFDGESDLQSSIRDFTRHTRGGLTFLISDLLGLDSLEAVLDLLPAPTWDVVILHLLHPEELEPQIEGEFQMVDVETGRAANYDVDAKALRTYRERLAAWRDELEMACVEQNAFYALIPTHWSLAGEILPHLRSVHVLNPL